MQQTIPLATGWNTFCVLVNDTRGMDEIFGHFGWFNSIWHWNASTQVYDSLGPSDRLLRGESYWVNYTGAEPTTITIGATSGTMDKPTFVQAIKKPINTAGLTIPPSEDWSDERLYNTWYLGEDPATHPDPGIMYLAGEVGWLFVIQIAGLGVNNPPLEDQIGFLEYIGIPNYGYFEVVSEIPEDLARGALKALPSAKSKALPLLFAGGVAAVGAFIGIT
jgi:hypothetical protein